MKLKTFWNLSTSVASLQKLMFTHIVCPLFVTPAVVNSVVTNFSRHRQLWAGPQTAELHIRMGWHSAQQTSSRKFPSLRRCGDSLLAIVVLSRRFLNHGLRPKIHPPHDSSLGVVHSELGPVGLGLWYRVWHGLQRELPTVSKAGL